MADLKSGWRRIRISEVADHCLGKMLDKKKNKGRFQPYLRNINVRWFEFDLSDLLEMKFDEGEEDRYQAKKGDLIVCEGGYPGRAAIWESDEPIYLQKALHRVRFHDPAHAKWVLYWLHLCDLNGSLSGSFSGAGIQQFTKTALARFEVPLAPAKELQRIMATLDQAFAALDRAHATAEANLLDVDALFESELAAAFQQAATGVRQLPLDELCETVTPKSKVKRKDYLEEGRFPVISQEASKVSGYWNDPDALLGLDAPVVVFGDHTRCLKYIDFDFVVGADGTKVLKPRPGISAAYLYYGLRSQPIESGGYARHFRFLREKTLPDISLEAQEALADKLERFERQVMELSERYQSKLDDIDALRQSLLQQAFSGQLT